MHPYPREDGPRQRGSGDTKAGQLDHDSFQPLRARRKIPLSSAALPNLLGHVHKITATQEREPWLND